MRDLPALKRLMDKGTQGADEAIGSIKAIVDFRPVMGAIGATGLSEGARLAIINGGYLRLVRWGLKKETELVSLLDSAKQDALIIKCPAS